MADLKVRPLIWMFRACGPKEKCVPGRSMRQRSHSMVISSALMNIDESLFLLGLARLDDGGEVFENGKKEAR